MNTAKLYDLQESMKDLPNQIEPHTDHFFSEGMYGRLMHLKAGESVVGKAHKHNHLAMLLVGAVSIQSKYGLITYNAAKGPCIINVLAGDKRAFFAHSDIQYITLHVTDETDLVKLEQELVGE